MCSSYGKSNGEVQMMNPNASLGGLIGGISGALGGEAAMTTMSASAFSNPYYAQGTMEQLAYLQSLYPPDVKAAIKSLEEPKSVKEAPKIELNPKRAVQLED